MTTAVHQRSHHQSNGAATEVVQGLLQSSDHHSPSASGSAAESRAGVQRELCQKAKAPSDGSVRSSGVKLALLIEDLADAMPASGTPGSFGLDSSSWQHPRSSPRVPPCQCLNRQQCVQHSASMRSKPAFDRLASSMICIYLRLHALHGNNPRIVDRTTSSIRVC